MFCSWKKMNSAKRRYMRGGLLVAFSYVGLVWVSSKAANQHGGVLGWDRVILAALPCLPILAFMVVIGRYLRDETDEYERDIVVRCFLWGMAVVLALTTFASFLRSYGWTGALPPFTEYMSFWATTGIARLVYKIANRPLIDD